jgi:autotransporter-associated beta strand protein
MRIQTPVQPWFSMGAMICAIGLATRPSQAGITINLPTITLAQTSTVRTGTFDVFVTSDLSPQPTIGDFYVDVTLPNQSNVTFTNPSGSPSQNASAAPSSAHPYIFGSQISTSSGSVTAVQATDFAATTAPTLTSGAGLLSINYSVAANVFPQNFSLSVDPSTFLDDGNSNPLSFSVVGGAINIQAAATWTGSAGDGRWSSNGNWSAIPGTGSNLIFAGTAAPTSVTNDNDLSSLGSVTFNSGAAAFAIGGTGSGSTIAMSGGMTNNSTNIQTVNLGLTLSSPQQFNAAAGNIVVSGTIANGGNTLTVTGTANTTLAGGLSGTGSLVKTGSGTLTVTGNNSYGGGTTVNGGMLVVGHVHALGTGGLTINNAAMTKLQAGLPSPVQLPTLSIAGGSTPTAKLDVTDNNMVLHNGSISTTLAQLKSGLNASGTLWTGTGIQSSTAAADAAAHGNATVFAVGAIKNVDKFGAAIYSTWPGSPSPDGGVSGLTTTDVLVKYTYFGDADLNGVVDNTTDYDLWSNGFTNPSLAATNGWLYGDFDFSGTVDNTTDYDLWSTGFAHQGGALSTSAAAGGTGAGSPGSRSPATDVQAVPEPSSVALAAIAVAAILVALQRGGPLGLRCSGKSRADFLATKTLRQGEFEFTLRARALPACGHDTIMRAEQKVRDDFSWPTLRKSCLKSNRAILPQPSGCCRWSITSFVNSPPRNSLRRNRARRCRRPPWYMKRTCG